MKHHKYLPCLGIFLTSIVGHAGTLIFEDTFDRADNSDINLNANSNQTGISAPLDYGSYGTDTGTSIASNTLSLNVDSSGKTRAALEYDFADLGTTITDDGGFEVSFTVDPGTNYVSGGLGSYAVLLFLSQKSVVESTINQANSNQSLALEIKGNGATTLYSQGTAIFPAASQGSWNTTALNDIKLVIATDGFQTTSSNAVSLYINDTIVTSGLSFDWTANDDVYLGIEATGNTSLIDDLSVSTIPEPAHQGVIISGFLTWVLLLRRNTFRKKN